jgi:phosphoribosylformylglycinamidine cyclo-ligase
MSEAYEKAGVDYNALDSGKRAAIRAASSTDELLALHGGRAFGASRGESAFVFSAQDRTYGFVLECLGTKSVLARRYQDASGVNLFRNIGYDAVAAIVNDLICVGALPLVVTAYFATGNASWYADTERFEALVEGWADACRTSGATWGGGESPSLPSLVSAEDIELAGSAMGTISGSPILGDRLSPGDEIVVVPSTGLHANGASLVRQVATDAEDGLLTKLPSGRSLGEAALDASAIYVGLVRALLEASVPVSYLSHITGHGLRKVMRPNRDFTYRLTQLPPVPEVLGALVDRLNLDPTEAYGTFNMGAGFAVYVPAGDGERAVNLAQEQGFDAILAGVVEEGPRRVILEPVDVTYASDTLSLR